MIKPDPVCRSAYIALFFILISGGAQAEQDFYGIQMKDEAWARALVLNQGSPNTADLFEGPVVNHAIHAEASLKEVADRRIHFLLTVFNDSSAQVPIDYHLRDFQVYTREGKKYSLIDTEEDLPAFIDPRSKMSFAPSFGNLSLSNSDVEMIVCSFNLGKTRVILFPWSKKDRVSKLVSPSAPPAPVSQEKKRVSRGEPKKERPEPRQGPRVKTPKRDFWDWLALGNKDRVTPEELRRAPVMPTAVDAPVPAVAGGRAPGGDLSPETQKKLDQAIQGFVYAPAGTVSASSSVASETDPQTARSEARVIDFNRPYNFVTLNLGEQDGLKNGTTLSIVRDGKLVARAQVKQVRAAVSAATLLPGTARSEVRAGDVVSFA